MHSHILDLFFRTLIYGLTVGFARRCNPFGRRKVVRTLTCIKIIPAFSAETEPKGVRVLPTSCGRQTAGHDACHFEKEAENIANSRFRNVLQWYCCKQLHISSRYRQKRLKFRFYMVGGVLSRYADISRRNRRYVRCVFRYFERTSEQDTAFTMVKGIAEKRRIELSPNRANNHRTSKPAWLKALQALFACSADFQLQRELLSRREKVVLIEQ